MYPNPFEDYPTKLFECFKQPCTDFISRPLLREFNEFTINSLSKIKSKAAGPADMVKIPSRGTRLLKTKQALLGFVNGFSIAAMADTGSRKNVMSESYAKSLGFTIEASPSTFEIGNSKKIQSIGKSTSVDPQRSSSS